MDLKQQNVLFFTRTMYLGGTENVVLQLCEIFKPLVNKIVVCSCGGVNIKRLDAMEIKHYEIPDIEKKSPIIILKTTNILKRIVIDENITIIHTHHRMAAFYVSLLQLYKRCTFINTSHNTFKSKKLLTRFSYKHAHLIACGEMVKRNLTEFFDLPYQQVTVIHNAVKQFNETVKIDPTIKDLHDNGYFVVGNVGRLSEQKGMEYFIQAIPMIIEKCHNSRFLIIGSGEDEAKLRQLSNDLKVNKYLIFMGYRNDIQNIMSQLDLVVLSSLWEGLPLTPIEAFSVGKTIVATAVDGTKEIVNDNKNGFLIKEKKPESIAEKVLFLLNNFEVKKEFELEAYQTFKSEYSFESFSQKLLEYYYTLK